MSLKTPGRVRSHIRVEGIVQGVGFRPFVYGLASEYGLAGFVGNDAGGVFIEAEGPPTAVAGFVETLRSHPPALAVIENVSVRELAADGSHDFHIIESPPGGRTATLVSPDTATCDDCLAEVLDPEARRHRYAFTNCTNCGPRFTIVTALPYDRPLTTMTGFAMCPKCAREYTDPTDRRFHAQPVCCPQCGPSLRFSTADGQPIPGDPVTTAAAWLLEGGVLAVKGLGGYHLAADAENETAVATLRARKHREDKPFAVMAPDLEAVERLCVLDQAAKELLASRRRPIVLLPRRGDARLAPAIAPGNRYLGVMLPYTPLHHLLAREMARPFVLTSGNLSDEPIAYLDDEALNRLGAVADGFLTHDRPVHIRTDDSVVRAFRGTELPIRRSRGYVPDPITLPWAFPRPVLACGAELKATFCLARDRHAFVSHHIGDLENYETLRSFTTGVGHFRRLFDISPQVVAYDLHPEYLSTKYALQHHGVELVGVQHHHAHIASCLADNGETGPVVGVAFDGLGYGTDGTIWGGEFLVADLADFERAGHLEPVAMPGGTAAIRQPWRMATSYLLKTYGDDMPCDLDVVRRNAKNWDAVLRLARSETNAPVTSSAGRLFDAVAALIGVRDAVTYEGQAAVELEQCANTAVRDAYPARVDGHQPFTLRGTDLVRAVVDDLRHKADPAIIAARFHNGIADAVVSAAAKVSEASGISTIALSGGVFQNVVLLDRVVNGIERHGLRVMAHSRIPPNDGGISLGQAAVAGARDRARY